MYGIGESIGVCSTMRIFRFSFESLSEVRYSILGSGSVTFDTEAGR